MRVIKKPYPTSTPTVPERAMQGKMRGLYPRTIVTPLPPVPERLIQRRKPAVEHQLGVYAAAVVKGEAGDSDISPDFEFIQDLRSIPWDVSAPAEPAYDKLMNGNEE